MTHSILLEWANDSQNLCWKGIESSKPTGLAPSFPGICVRGHWGSLTRSLEPLVSSR